MAITKGVNGYVTVAEFKDWATARLKSISEYTDPQIEAAIVISSLDFIDSNYRFRGYAVDDGQAMQLPTDDVMIDDIRNGACQAVWQQLIGKLFVTESGYAGVEIESESSKLGDLAESVTYKSGSRKQYTYNTSRIDGLLRPYLSLESSGMRLYRV